MSYKVEITAATTAELAGKLLALAAQMQGTDPVMPEVKEAAKPKKAKAEKAASEISPEPQPEPETAPEPEAQQPNEISPEPQPEAAPKPLDFDKQVAPVVLEGVKRRGKEWVADILSQFGVERASQVPDDRLAELVAVIKEGLE